MVEDDAEEAAAADEQASWVNPTDFVTKPNFVCSKYSLLWPRLNWDADETDHWSIVISFWNKIISLMIYCSAIDDSISISIIAFNSTDNNFKSNRLQSQQNETQRSLMNMKRELLIIYELEKWWSTANV